MNVLIQLSELQSTLCNLHQTKPDYAFPGTFSLLYTPLRATGLFQSAITTVKAAYRLSTN
jgi:hypothetical protein